jgi:hypothetical protein
VLLAATIGQQTVSPEPLSEKKTTMEEFCNQHLQDEARDDWSFLATTSRHFLGQLGLPALHPFCNESSQSRVFPSAPEMGPPTKPHDNNIVEAIVTLWYYYVPPTFAFFLVWFFLFAGYIAPLGTLTLLCLRNLKRTNLPLLDHYPVVALVTLLSSWIVMTDDQYLIEFGRVYGMMLLVLSLNALQITRKWVPLLSLLFLICYSMSPWEWEDPDNIPTMANAGLYYNERNPLIYSMVSKWEWSLPEYSKVASPIWMTGDARTGMQYFFGYVAVPPRFHRVWLPTFDEEFVALDISFPPKVGHDWQKPLYLVLHGLNGGSKEGYVIDFCHERNKEGSTCVVLIARGLGDTPIQGWTVSGF